MCFQAEKMISTLPPTPPQKYKIRSEAGKKMTHFSLTEKRKRRKEGGKKERRERKEEKGEERRKKRKEAKKECKYVFRLKK